MSKTNDSKSKRIYNVLDDTDPPDVIKLKVSGQDGRGVSFKVHLDRNLERVLRTYCEKIQVDYRTMRFFYNGDRRVHGHETPRQLGMEHDDSIDAMTEADGGGPFISKTA